MYCLQEYARERVGSRTGILCEDSGIPEGGIHTRYTLVYACALNSCKNKKRD